MHVDAVMLRWALSFAFATGLGCEHDELPELVTIPGDRVDYRHSLDFEPCAGNAPAVDAFALHVAGVLGGTEGPREFPHVTHAWLTDEDFTLWTGGTCADTIGCAIRTHAFTTILVHGHEIVHALNPEAPRFLDEGLAVALDPGSWSSTIEPDERDPRPYLLTFILDGEERAGDAYGVAGLFVSYLLQVHGVEKFQAVFRAIPRKSTSADWESAFSAHYGRSVDEMVEAYLSATTCPGEAAPLPRFECSAPQILPTEGRFRFARVIDCSDEDVVGGVDLRAPEGARPELGLRLTRSLVIESAGEYEITVDTPATAGGTVGYATLEPCERCSWLPEPGIAVTSGSGGSAQWLDAGRYILTIYTPQVVTQDVSASVHPVP